MDLVSYIKAVYSYNPKTGLISRTKNHRFFRSKLPVGSLGFNGYLVMSVRDKTFRYSRIAWVLHHGTWPVNEIDHLNCIRTDNRIENLRDVSGSKNQQNKQRYQEGRLLGASFRKESGKWSSHAPLEFQGKKIPMKKYLGLFETELDAHMAMVQFYETVEPSSEK